VKLFYALAVTKIGMVRNFEVISDRVNTVGIRRINGSVVFVPIRLQAYLLLFSACN
jgi:hypothetical protein